MASPSAKVLVCSLLGASCMSTGKLPRPGQNHWISALKHRVLNPGQVGFFIAGKEESSSGSRSK